MKRILIEFYSGNVPENLLSLLKERFDGIAFFYFQTKTAPSPFIQKQISSVISELVHFTPEFIAVSRYEISSVLDAFRSLIREGSSYAFDITGGDELFLTASGLFLSQNPSLSLSIHRYEIFSEKKIEEYPHYTESQCDFFPRNLSVSQILSLNGTPPIQAPHFSFSRPDLKREILRLWEAVGKHPRDWNRFCSLSANEDSFTQKINKKLINGSSSDSRCYQTISAALKNANILNHEEESRTGGRTYMNFQLNVPEEFWFLYEKAGNLLEMFAALCAYETDLFGDIRVGVTADWNGIIRPKHIPDPRNEIDIIMTYGNLPVLASCKNTVPKNDHLYEIATMANHYGGHFAKAVLFASMRATPTVRERAKEMKILLIDNIQNTSPKALTEIIRKRFNEMKEKTQS